MIRVMTFLDKLIQNKTGYAFLLSATTYPIVEFVETYIFKDWQFAIFLMVVVVIDTILGFVKHFIHGTLSSGGFSRVFTKVLVYGSVLILTHVLVSYTVRDEINVIFSWFDSVMYGAIMLREAISVIENIGAINPTILPSWILKRLKAFDKNGGFKNEPADN